MFGSDYLVAPICYENQFKRKLYLPEGTWKNLNDGKEYSGQITIEADAPIDCIPVFQKLK